MNRKDIIRMADENGIVIVGEAMFRFAALVAAAEREQCHALLLEIKRKCEDDDRMWQIEDFIDEAIRARG